MGHKISVMRDFAVRIVETGETFYNGWALADEKGFKETEVRKCLKDSSLTCNGFHLIPIDPVEAGFDEAKEY